MSAVVRRDNDIPAHHTHHHTHYQPLQSTIHSNSSSDSSNLSTTQSQQHKRNAFKSLVSPSGDDDTPLSTLSETYSNIMHVPSSHVCRPGSWPAFKSNAIAGAFSLSTAFAFMHPLDTIKTQIQASNNYHYNTLFTRSTGKTLLNGFTASIAGAAPQGAMRFSTYESVKLQLITRCTDTHPYLCTPLISSAISAMCGDMVSSIVKVPREVITQRLQATKLYASTFDAIKSIFYTEGIRGFYTGYISTQARDLPFMMFLFSCYENIKSLTGELCETSTLASALFGASSGAVAGFTTTPADVLKTRIMTSAIPSSTGGKLLTMSLTDAYQQTIQHSGIRGLFVGSIPRSIWWFGVCGIFFPCYEQSKAAVHYYHAVKHGHIHDDMIQHQH